VEKNKKCPSGCGAYPSIILDVDRHEPIKTLEAVVQASIDGQVDKEARKEHILRRDEAFKNLIKIKEKKEEERRLDALMDEIAPDAEQLPDLVEVSRGDRLESGSAPISSGSSNTTTSTSTSVSGSSNTTTSTSASEYWNTTRASDTTGTEISDGATSEEDTENRTHRQSQRAQRDRQAVGNLGNRGTRRTLEVSTAGSAPPEDTGSQGTRGLGRGRGVRGVRGVRRLRGGCGGLLEDSEDLETSNRYPEGTVLAARKTPKRV